MSGKIRIWCIFAGNTRPICFEDEPSSNFSELAHYIHRDLPEGTATRAVDLEVCKAKERVPVSQTDQPDFRLPEASQPLPHYFTLQQVFPELLPSSYPSQATLPNATLSKFRLEGQPLGEGDLHIIVHLPTEAGPLGPPLHAADVAFEPDLTFILPTRESFAKLTAEHLRSNMRETSGDAQQTSFLTRKRLFKATPESDYCRLYLQGRVEREIFDQRFGVVPAENESVEADSCQHGTEKEMAHYTGAIITPGLLNGKFFSTDKEPQIFGVLMGFVVEARRRTMTWGFRTGWPFLLIASISQSQEKYQYQPRSDFHIRHKHVPILVLEIISSQNESDRYRMLLQSSRLARFCSRLRKDRSKVFFVLAIYIDNECRASLYLVYQPDQAASATHQMQITQSAMPIPQYICVGTFDLLIPTDAVDFMSRIYNFLSRVAEEDNLESEGNLAAADAKKEVQNKHYPSLTFTANDQTHSTPSECQTEYSPLEDPSVRSELQTHGYTITLENNDGLKRFVPLKPTVRTATSGCGDRVIVKLLPKTSPELEFLQKLHEIPKATDYIIPLLDIVPLTIGKSIVLPLMTVLPSALGDFPGAAVLLCKQFLEAVAFLHRNGVAHCDLKPENAVVDVRAISDLAHPIHRPRLQLFLIDFSVSVFINSNGGEIHGWRGTRGWVAPEIEAGDGGSYDAESLDLFASGRVSEYILGFCPIALDEEGTRYLEFARLLQSRDPSQRPTLDKRQEFLYPRPPKRRADQDPNERQIQKRPNVFESRTCIPPID